jgi:hypothetical protein
MRYRCTVAVRLGDFYQLYVILIIIVNSGLLKLCYIKRSILRVVVANSSYLAVMGGCSLSTQSSCSALVVAYTRRYAYNPVKDGNKTKLNFLCALQPEQSFTCEREGLCSDEQRCGWW